MFHEHVILHFQRRDIDVIVGHDTWWQLLGTFHHEIDMWLQPKMAVLRGREHHPSVNFESIAEFKIRELEARQKRDRDRFRDRTAPTVL